MDTLIDRAALWTVRAAATIMLFAGVSVFVAAVPVTGMLPDSPVARGIGAILFQLGAVSVAAGAAAIYLSRPRALLLPNEHTTITRAERPPLGGWLLALAAVLGGLPVWLLVALRSFLAEWRFIFDLLATSEMWNGANASAAGVVLLPLFGALTPPFIELMTAVAFVAAAPLLLILLLRRSGRLPRVYLVAAVLLSALVIDSVRAAAAARLAGDAVQRLVESSKPRPEEVVQLREGLDRYTRAVSSTAPVLVAALFGYLLWIPSLLRSRRARLTFAAAADDQRGTTAGSHNS